MMAHHTRASILVALVACAAACTKPAPPRPSVDAAAPTAPIATVATPSADGKAIVAGACLSCHTEELLAQQRLPKEKWAATVKKMTTWGANLDSPDTEALVTYLAAAYGPDAGPWEPASISAEAARRALAPEDDGVFAGGDVTRGRDRFVQRCAACHGMNARGAIGVNLVERPILYRAQYVASTVREGRGKMTPLPRTTDQEIGDILAYLRSLRVP
jgi:cytochrome c oxidase cbb3-type subunit 3